MYYTVFVYTITKYDLLYTFYFQLGVIILFYEISDLCEYNLKTECPGSECLEKTMTNYYILTLYDSLK